MRRQYFQHKFLNAIPAELPHSLCIQNTQTVVPMIESSLNILFLLCCGFCTGTLSGLLGIGGGMITVPLFCLVFNISLLPATATSLFVIILTSIFGTIARLYNKTCLLRIGLITGLSGAPVAFFWHALRAMLPTGSSCSLPRSSLRIAQLIC